MSDEPRDGWPADLMKDSGSPVPNRRQLVQGVAGFLALAGFSGCASQETADEAASGAAAAADGALPEQLWRGGAGQLARAIQSGEVSSFEVVDAHLARIEEVNEKVNAVVAVYPEEAREAARAADASVAGGDALGPLHGVPFTIMHNIGLRGKPNTRGLYVGADSIAERDHPCVERMRGAGAIPLGRTNLPDMGLRVHSHSELWGRTLNPWSPDHNVGGSSGGEGAALATGMTPIGLGNDIGGSLRNPANCCAIASLKPSFGRIPGSAGTIMDQLMAVDGPMARQVADVRLGYEVLAGVHPLDPWTAPVPLDLPRPESKRVALVPEPSGGATDPTVAEGVRAAGRALEAAGYEVEEIEPPRLVDVYTTWFDFIGVGIEGGLDFFREVMAQENFQFLDLVMQRFESGGLDMYADATQRRHALLIEWNAFFERYPLVVGPVFTQPPFEIGYDIAGVDEAWDVLNQLRLVAAPNILGLPAAAVPVGIGDDGLPRGVQVIAARFYDGLTLEGAAAIEESLGRFTPIDPRS